jgi:hypothetical protein
VSLATPYKPGALNILVAFPYFSRGIIDVLKAHAGEYNLLIDSGAFTAWKSGNPIRLSHYCQFLDAVPVPFFRYFMLDVIGDPAMTERNFRKMRALGYSPIPVFTPGSTWQQFDYYYTESDMLATGGLTKNKYDPKSQKWLDAIMARAAGRPMHLLGYTSPTWMKYRKPYSCDSSTWSNGARFAALNLYVGNGDFKAISKESAVAGLTDEARAAIEALGFSANALQRSDQWNWLGIGDINIASWVYGASQYEKRLDVRVFLATPSGDYLAKFFEQRERLAKRGMV